MPWFMPSYGRPDAPRKLVRSPGGMPSDVVVLVNDDDDSLDLYRSAEPDWPAGWRMLVVPPGSRFCEAVRAGFDEFTDANYFGIIDDDYWPITPGWWDKMIDAAGGTGVAIANNRQNFPHPWTCRVMGGALARAIGTIAPGRMRHNFSDDTWKQFADDFKVYHPLQDVIVEHHHHTIKKDVQVDSTYQRGSHDFEEDRKHFAAWMNSQERVEQCKRVAELLGVQITVNTFESVRLAIITPVGDHKLDLCFHQSLWNTLQLNLQKRINTFFFHQAGASHIGKTREAALWQAYYSTPPVTHFLWIDSDMGWEARLIPRLISSGHEFTGVAGVKKTDEVQFCFNPLPGHQVVIHPVTKFIGVEHVGFGFVMLKRSVIDKMIAGYPELEYHSHDPGGRKEYALFLDMITGDRLPSFSHERLSEDLSFCERWRMLGGEIWLDADAALIHAGRKEYTGAARWTMEKIDAA